MDARSWLHCQKNWTSSYTQPLRKRESYPSVTYLPHGLLILNTLHHTQFLAPNCKRVKRCIFQPKERRICQSSSRKFNQAQCECHEIHEEPCAHQEPDHYMLAHWNSTFDYNQVQGTNRRIAWKAIQGWAGKDVWPTSWIFFCSSQW